MPLDDRRPAVQDADPADAPEVTAARISRRGALWAALIGVAGTVLVAVLSPLLSGSGREPDGGDAAVETSQGVVADDPAASPDAPAPAEPAARPRAGGPTTIVVDAPEDRVGVVDLDTATTSGVRTAEWVAIEAGEPSPFEVGYSFWGYCEGDACIRAGLQFAGLASWSSAEMAPADEAACTTAADDPDEQHVDEKDLAEGDVICLRTSEGGTARMVVKAVDDMSVTVSVETW